MLASLSDLMLLLLSALPLELVPVMLLQLLKWLLPSNTISSIRNELNTNPSTSPLEEKYAACSPTVTGTFCAGIADLFDACAAKDGKEVSRSVSVGECATAFHFGLKLSIKRRNFKTASGNCELTKISLILARKESQSKAGDARKGKLSPLSNAGSRVPVRVLDV